MNSKWCCRAAYCFAATPGFDQRSRARAPYLDALEKLVTGNVSACEIPLVFDPMHGSAAGLLPELFGRNGIHSDEIRGRATRVSAACIRAD